MSQTDLESKEMPEGEDVNTEKLVPVSEAIRYRKRAQNAEKEATVFEEQLKLSNVKNEELAEYDSCDPGTGDAGDGLPGQGAG